MERVIHSDNQILNPSLLKPGGIYKMKRSGSPVPSREFFLLKQQLPQGAILGDMLFVDTRGRLSTCISDQLVKLKDVGILPRVDGSWAKDKWLEVVDDYLPVLQKHRHSISLTPVV